MPSEYDEFAADDEMYEQCVKLRKRAEAAEAEVERLKRDVQGFLHTLASFALEDEDPDVRVALGKERAKVQSLTADLRVAVEALRTRHGVLLAQLRVMDNENAIDEAARYLMCETCLPRDFFDRHIAKGDGENA